MLVAAAAACAPLRGYPTDPEDTATTLQALKIYFAPDQDTAYYTMNPGQQRQRQRDLIVTSRMRAYDIEFDEFENRLNGDGNTTSVGGDILLLTLSALTATTGSIATKAALGASSTAVLGAQTAFNKDLYYQKTLPALLAQMEANRLRARLTLMQGLNLDDTKYPLANAELDLDALKRAGSVPSAIGNITQQAETDKAVTTTRLDALRASSFNTSSSTERLLAWLYPKGRLDAARHPIAPDPLAWAALNAWMSHDSDPNINGGKVAPAQLITSDSPGLEEARQRLLASSANIP